MQAHLIEVSFAMSSDPEEKLYLNELPTSFDLEDEQVDRLIEFGRRTFRASPDRKMLLDRLEQRRGLVDEDQPSPSAFGS